MSFKKWSAWFGFALMVAILMIRFINSRPIIPQNSAMPSDACTDNCSLIIEPDDGIEPVIAMIRSAKHSVDLVIYELQDLNIENALIDAARRGVTVRVLMSPGYAGDPSTFNEPAFKKLSTGGVQVKWSPGYFALTHEKSFVFDDAVALIMTFNLVKKYYPTGRDFGMVDRSSKDISAMENIFDADWNNDSKIIPGGENLVWSPGSRTTLINLIEDAKKSLLIYNEEMDDDQIETALAEAAERGVAVKIVMTYSPDWKTAFSALESAGVNIRTYSASAALYIHAKMILADGVEAFVGSENFSATSLDLNRELGIMITDKNVLRSLSEIFNDDWAAARPFK